MSAFIRATFPLRGRLSGSRRAPLSPSSEALVTSASARRLLSADGAMPSLSPDPMLFLRRTVLRGALVSGMPLGMTVPTAPRGTRVPLGRRASGWNMGAFYERVLVGSVRLRLEDCAEEGHGKDEHGSLWGLAWVVWCVVMPSRRVRKKRSSGRSPAVFCFFFDDGSTPHSSVPPTQPNRPTILTVVSSLRPARRRASSPCRARSARRASPRRGASPSGARSRARDRRHPAKTSRAVARPIAGFVGAPSSLRARRGRNPPRGRALSLRAPRGSARTRDPAIPRRETTRARCWSSPAPPRWARPG